MNYNEGTSQREKTSEAGTVRVGLFCIFFRNFLIEIWIDVRRNQSTLIAKFFSFKSILVLIFDHLQKFMKIISLLRLHIRKKQILIRLLAVVDWGFGLNSNLSQ